MSELTQAEILANQQEITELTNKNAKSLPDSPSQKGMSSALIKRHFYDGEFYLLNKIQAERKKISDAKADIESIEADVGGLGERVNNLENSILFKDLFEDTDYVIAEEDK